MSEREWQELDAFAVAFAKLSPADQDQARIDMSAYGQCVLHTATDGTVTLHAPESVFKPPRNPYTEILKELERKRHA